jgi:hypothetical protein
MPRMGFEPTTTVFERAKTVQALDHAATVISIENILHKNKYSVSTKSHVQLYAKCYIRG